MTPILILFYKYGKYLKYIGIVLLVSILVFSVYRKGYKDHELKIEREINQKIQEDQEKVERERDRTNHLRDSIRKDREKNPSNDSRDSCILSNDPYHHRCI